MISSPTEKGVVMIGGRKKIGEYSSDLLELSGVSRTRITRSSTGDSQVTLEWNILKQKLQQPRQFHVTFSISNDIAAILGSKQRILCFPCFVSKENSLQRIGCKECKESKEKHRENMVKTV